MNCAVNAQHTVQCWGPNYVGMLGGGTTEPGVVTVTDLRDVELSGGKIEVLGVTRSLQRIGPDADASAPPAFPAPTARPRTRR